MAALTAPPINFQERIRSALAESLSLSYWDLVPAAVHLRTTLSGSGSGSDFFRVDGGVSFLVYEIHGHLAMNQISSEQSTNQNTYAGLLGANNRALVKALNCDITLTNPDRESMEYFITDVQNNSGGSEAVLPLSALFEDAGGGPIVFAEGVDVMPLIINENDRIQMTATLRQTLPEKLALATEYGVTLMGVFLRARPT